MNRISIDVRDIPEPAWLDRLEAFAQRALAMAGAEDWDLSLALCGDGLIASLNAEYRGKEGPTDVLSFEQGEWFDDPELGGRRFLAGDIVISLEALRRNAQEFSVPEDEELKRLVIHGILHLSGLDHEGTDPSEPMLAKQEDMLKSLAEERIL